MPWKSSLLILGLVIGLSGAGFSAANAAAVNKQQALHAQQAKAAQAAKARKAAAAKQQKMKKREWYEDDRDRGLDIASEYAPDTIARVRKKNYIAKGDTVKTGSGKRGWQHYMDKYYKR